MGNNIRPRQRCENLNHRRSDAPVRHCPICGDVVNETLPIRRCPQDDHARMRRERNGFCVHCGEQLIERDRMLIETVNGPHPSGPARTALLLAAGTGSRLQPLTHDAPKCLTEVNGVPILEQQVRCLERCGFERLVVVLGHRGDQIREFLDSNVSDLEVSYIHNPRFRTTNNLFSLWLARNAIERPFLLLECDLFFEPDLLSRMLQPDSIALATRRPWMNGTTVTLDDSQRVCAFQLGGATAPDLVAYKTVNIYSLSLLTWHHMRKRLDAYVSSGRVSDYYEAVFRDMTAGGAFRPHTVFFDDGRWYEIDAIEDLRAAERLFANSRHRETKNAGVVGGFHESPTLGETVHNGALPAPQPRRPSRSAGESCHG